jgi:hypothetical protein
MAAIANARASVTLVNIVILLGTKPKPASADEIAQRRLYSTLHSSDQSILKSQDTRI